MPKGIPKTDDEKKAIARDYDAGIHARDICKKYKVSQQQVYKYVNQFGMGKKKRAQSARLDAASSSSLTEAVTLLDRIKASLLTEIESRAKLRKILGEL